MRVALSILIILVLLGWLGFMLTNSEERVNLALLGTRYVDVELWKVAFGAFALGVAFTAVVAVIEGAQLRLANLKLRRQLNRIESDLAVHGTTGPEMDRSDADSRPAALLTSPAGSSSGTSPPSAPVYGGAEEDLDPEDDLYSGGRAV